MNSRTSRWMVGRLRTGARAGALAATLAVALSGCGLFSKAPGTSVVEFYNHSGRTLLVEGNELEPGDTGTFSYPSEGIRPPLIVFHGGCVQTYIAPQRKPDSQFRATDWMMRGAYRVQLETDGRLYLVPPGLKLPADPAAMTQPDGFPLLPREGSSCAH